ncbi:MAG: peptidylprolyl isomerase [Thermodesulfobacteriota bacterium]|jgi:peptidyl-prolyl cis-trans isomerase SurA
MKTAIEKIIPYLIAGLLFFSLGGTRGEVVERIVALVNTEVVTLSELEEEGRHFFDQVQRSTSPSEREEKLREARKAVLDQLIENKLLDQEIRSKKIEVPEREVDAAIQDIMNQNHLTENELKKALAKDGLTYSHYRQRLRESLGKMHLVNREIKSKIVIKEEDLRKTYSQNLKGYTDPLEVKVQQIFLPIPQWATEEQITTIRKEAQSILGKARQGEDFAQLAVNYSKGPEASEGGVLGFFKPKELRPELEEAAFKLKPGELSDLIKSPEGFHILRVMERKGGEPKPFAEVQDKIRDEMVQAEGERQFREWMKALRAKAYIEVRLQ